MQLLTSLSFTVFLEAEEEVHVNASERVVLHRHVSSTTGLLIHSQEAPLLLGVCPFDSFSLDSSRAWILMVFAAFAASKSLSRLLTGLRQHVKQSKYRQKHRTIPPITVEHESSTPHKRREHPQAWGTNAPPANTTGRLPLSPGHLAVSPLEITSISCHIRSWRLIENFTHVFASEQCLSFPDPVTTIFDPDPDPDPDPE